MSTPLARSAQTASQRWLPIGAERVHTLGMTLYLRYRAWPCSGHDLTHVARSLGGRFQLCWCSSPFSTARNDARVVCYRGPMHADTFSKRLLPWLVAIAFSMESEALKVAPLSMKAVLPGYTESRGFYSDRRLDGGSIRNAPGVRICHRPLHVRIVSERTTERQAA